jgi:hypothetical protein
MRMIDRNPVEVFNLKPWIRTLGKPFNPLVHEEIGRTVEFRVLPHLG